ncbi:MAG: monovalent cation/H(+) antiporter subunit G [Bacteroidales bacterium]|nr:monovalent cation/H(+) antiporter subunit G [Bacteroidales bacterium]
MSTILQIIGGFLILVGSIFLFLGALGIYRMPDVYNRLQAGTKATTLGAMSLILGVGFLSPSWMMKALILIIFIAFSNPLSSHALARAMHIRGRFPKIYSNNAEEYDAYRKVEMSEKKEEVKS